MSLTSLSNFSFDFLAKASFESLAAFAAFALSLMVPPTAAPVAAPVAAMAPTVTATAVFAACPMVAIVMPETKAPALAAAFPLGPGKTALARSGTALMTYEPVKSATR